MELRVRGEEPMMTMATIMINEMELLPQYFRVFNRTGGLVFWEACLIGGLYCYMTELGV